MIRFKLQNNVLTAVFNGEEIGSYQVGVKFCIIDSSEFPIRGNSEEEEVNDFLIYIKDQVMGELDEIPHYWIVCNKGHTWEESLFRFLGLKTHLHLYQGQGPFKVLKSQCPQCWYASQ